MCRDQFCDAENGVQGGEPKRNKGLDNITSFVTLLVITGFDNPRALQVMGSHLVKSRLQAGVNSIPSSQYAAASCAILGWE